MTPDAQKSAADKLTRDVLGDFRRAGDAVGLDEDEIDSLLATGELEEGFFDFAMSDQQRRLEGQMKETAGHITDWAGRMRRWAENGKRDDRSAYNWVKWEDYGRSLQRDCASWAGISSSESPVRLFVEEVVVKSVKDTGAVVAAVAETAADVATPWNWSLKTKLIVGVVAGTVVLGIAYPYVAPLLALVPKRAAT